MKLAKKANAKNSSARVVDGKLILSYPEALNPVVWQMDLTQTKASALEVSESSKGIFLLTLKTAKGESTDIAPFASKQEAVEALMAASEALANGQGQIRLAPAPAEVQTIIQQKSAKNGSWMGSFLAVLLIVMLLGVWSLIAARHAASVGEESLNPNMSLNSDQDQNGVPLSADDYLMKHQPPQ